MNQSPSSFCTIATYPCASELVGHLYSLSLYHPNAPVICLVDTKTKAIIENLTLPPRLNIQLFPILDQYTIKTRQEMEKDGTWAEFQMSKATAIEIALQSYNDTLFLDSDIYVLNKIYVNPTKQLGVSPHFIKKEDEDKFGKYNGGVLWTNNSSVPNDWREFTKRSRFYDQASIEDLVGKYEYFEFDKSYNFSWWRVFQSDISPRDILKNISLSETDILYNNVPIKFVHTHFNRQNQFNDIILSLLTKLKRYTDLLIIQRIIDEYWTIYVPKQPQNEPWSHKNDSFRELCVLIQKNNKGVVIKHEPTIHHCYLGTKSILLYDRPTLQWFDADAAQAFCIYLGNNDIENEGKVISKSTTAVVRPWTFWARRPLVLETLLATGLGSKTFSQRCHSIFIGNIENGVQEKYRNNPNWVKHIEEFHCTKGSKYLFNPKEYLEKISSAKYGLCLRGFGSKCHREIELMSVGTVPLITPDVDVHSYLSPLIENVHYLSVTCPEDIQQIANLSEKKWTEMSEACKEWYFKNAHSSNMFRNLLSDIIYKSNDA